LQLPIRLTNPDIRVQGGGHLLSLTHSEQINKMIARFVNGIMDGDNTDAGLIDVTITSR
jgi:hypothetical protein